MSDRMDCSSDEDDFLVVAATQPGIGQPSRHVPESNVFSHNPVVNRLRYAQDSSTETASNGPGWSCPACGPVHNGVLQGNRVSAAELRRFSQACKFCAVVLQAIIFHHPEGPNASVGAIQDWTEAVIFDSQGGALKVTYTTRSWTDALEPELRLQFHADKAYTEDVAPWAIFLDEHPICQNLFADACWTRVRGWLDSCVAQHTLCPFDQQTDLPTRYVSISTSLHGPPSLRLCETKTGEKGRYAALSHVWAASKASIFKTFKTNLQTRRTQIQYNDMPKTFREAVDICIKLNIASLWIDSICIVQDDTTDWQTEASRMGSYYASAYITIAAHPTERLSTATGQREVDTAVDNGCHLIRANHFSATISGEDSITPVTVFAHKTYNHRQFTQRSLGDGRSAYFKRGWCFQERMLAPRILHLTESEAIFECNSALRCECGGVESVTQPSSSHPGPLKPLLANALRLCQKQPSPSTQDVCARETVLKAYYHLIRDYAEKHLTKSTDLLPALSSIASNLAVVLGDEYHAGIWESDKYTGLQWTSYWGTDFGTNGREDCSRHGVGTYVAPSFSWASRQGGVSSILNGFASLDPEGSEHWEYASVEIKCDRAGLDPFGQLAGGYLKIRTCGIPVVCGDFAGPAQWGQMKLTGDGIRGEGLFQVDAREDVPLVVAGPVVCLELKRAKVTKRWLDEGAWVFRGGRMVYEGGEGEETVSMGAIVVIPADERTWRRVGFVMCSRYLRDWGMQEYVIV
ncbi:hypothetical protein OQA88_792 [Cercophora sp. LCS_1]